MPIISRILQLSNNPQRNALLVQPLPVTRTKLAAEMGKYYADVIASCKRGWKNIHKRRRRLYALWDELCLSPDIVLSLGDRILVPPTLRKPVLVDLHSGHLGIEKMKSLSRLTCWWPEINGDITAFARECSLCLHKIHSTPSQRTPWPIRVLFNHGNACT